MAITGVNNKGGKTITMGADDKWLMRVCFVNDVCDAACIRLYVSITKGGSVRKALL